ncbi:breast cancer anti-estrogen resistance protein 1-like isoform X2 [Acanthaster planci]|uniref:Breast cancer anti-estrogen resistance protein 1 n=1 Tax=Acanthaster planci TaxID=133434 RepID=A0A8B7YHU1_ACAPL|nr:breast cancer anti-estrogen resistance protein 1-like isoform X2 [Acanthaster planci]XP_022092182.1 breast cancer anti-estrogen resistance protein 1-like isoform X2 [Acanthaster planci]
MAYQPHVLARALYDNAAEAPDELSFRKGDIVTVLEQNTSGLEGWWLCCLNGRQGIAPGNRLKILAGMYESPHSPPPSQTAQKIKTPMRVGQSYIYDSPGGFRAPGVSRQDDYDVPPIRGKGYNTQNLGYQTVPGASRNATTHQTSVQETYDVPPNLQSSKSPSPSEMSDAASALLQKKSVNELYDLPKMQEQTQQEVYDTLPASKDPKLPMEIYDSPPVKGKIVDSPPKSPVEVYDVPSSLQAGQSGGAVKLPASPERSISSNGHPAQNSNSLELYDTLPGQKYPADVYDVPPAHEVSAKRPSIQIEAKELYDSPSSAPSQGLYDSPPKTKISVQHSADHLYDIPPQVTRDQPLSGRASPVHRGSLDNINGKMSLLSMTRLTRSAENLDEMSGGWNSELDITSAMELLSEKQQVLETAVAYLMSYVSSTWRHQSNLEPRIHEIKSACKQLNVALEEFLEFADRCVAGAARHSEELWPGKLSKSAQTMRESHASMVKSHAALDEMNWQVSKLVYKPGSSAANDLDQIALSARSVSDDMKRFVSLVQENATTLFRPSLSRNLSNPQDRPLPIPPAMSSSSGNRLSPDKESPAKGAIQSRPLPQVPPGGAPASAQPDDPNLPPNKEAIADYGYLTKKDPLIDKQIIVTDPGAKQPSVLQPNDKQILAFYVNDVESLVNTMTSAIDLFFTCIEANQPPKVFVAHSKHIILIGHKLVFIGDTLHHNLQHPEVRTRIIRCSDALCECLNSAVNTTKTAALQYPAVGPLQEMVDRITDAANSTQDLKAAILQCAAL